MITRTRIKDNNDLERFSEFLDQIYEDTHNNSELFPMLISTANMGDKYMVTFEALTQPADGDIVMDCETPISSFDDMVANIVTDMRTQVQYVIENGQQIAEDWAAESGADIEDCLDNNDKFVKIYSNLADYIESIS